MGHFIGELTSVNLQGTETKFHMELKINERSDSSYNFTLVYGKDSLRQERAYQLIPDGKAHFILDEKNGILLDMSLGNGALVSVFLVQDNLLHVSYALSKKGIRFELTSSSTAKLTGGFANDMGEEIPYVQSYKTIAFQYAFLKRKK